MSDATTTTTTAAPKTAKAVKPAAKASPFEAFTFPKVEVPDAFRSFAEQGSKQAKESYEKFRTAAEEATDVIEDTFESTRSGIVALNAKALDAAQANAEATFKFAREILTVKTFAEAIELQSSFFRSQFEALTAQAKDFQEVATKVAGEAAQPAKDAFAKISKLN